MIGRALAETEQALPCSTNGMVANVFLRGLPWLKETFTVVVFLHESRVACRSFLRKRYAVGCKPDIDRTILLVLVIVAVAVAVAVAVVVVVVLRVRVCVCVFFLCCWLDRLNTDASVQEMPVRRSPTMACLKTAVAETSSS